jgi:excisionase family DNA binding protein
MNNDPVTLPVKDFCKYTGISKSSVYRMLDAGLLESVKICTMRLVVFASYRELMKRSRVPPKAPAA